MTITAEVRHMRWERNQQMLGDYMTCMGTCMNGAGTGTIQVIIQVVIHWARPRGLTAWSAAGAGTIQPRACVPRTGSATTRTSGATNLASGSSAPSLTGSSKLLKSLQLFG